jgi:hypothetical protein
MEVAEIPLRVPVCEYPDPKTDRQKKADSSFLINFYS